MDKWNECVQKWQEWAREKERPVDFPYWGEYEIFIRLTRDEQPGRYFFWFNKDYLGQEWFKRQIPKVVANAGPRYLPELNIELPIAQVFEGLGRSPDFHARLQNLLTSVKRTYTKAVSPRARDAAATAYVQLQSALDSLLAIPLHLTEHTVPSIDFAKIAQLCSQADETAWVCIGELEQVAKKRRKQSTAPPKTPEQTAKDVYTTPEDFSHERHRLLNLTYALGNLQAFTESHEARLANTPALVMVGEAGIGKTHLFSDIARR
jgi:chromosomal replication initiation ATPase DnaA